MNDNAEDFEAQSPKAEKRRFGREIYLGAAILLALLIVVVFVASTSPD